MEDLPREEVLEVVVIEPCEPAEVGLGEELFADGNGSLEHHFRAADIVLEERGASRDELEGRKVLVENVRPLHLELSRTFLLGVSDQVVLGIRHLDQEVGLRDLAARQSAALALRCATPALEAVPRGGEA